LRLVGGDAGGDGPAGPLGQGVELVGHCP
jgi:hypothetical protein